MAYSMGVNELTGRPLTDWEDVVQSIRKILTTALGSRIQRHDFGSEVPALLDRPLTDHTILAVYAATAIALQPRVVDGLQFGEPRFAMTGCQITRAGGDGALELVVSGYYLPRGHLGDTTPANDNIIAARVALTGS